MQIELIYALSIGISIAILIATLYGKLTIPIAILSFLTFGLGIAWALAPYTSLVMTPLANSIWYGYSWGWVELFALTQIITTFFWAIPIMLYNFYATGGKTGWT